MTIDTKRTATVNLLGAALLVAFADSQVAAPANKYETRTAWGKACAEETVIPFEAQTFDVKTENGIETVSAISFIKTETVHSPHKGIGCRSDAVVMPSFQVEQFGEQFFAGLLGDSDIAHQAAMALDQPERFKAFRQDWNI